MIDVTRDELIEVRKLASQVFGNSVSPNTCYRWIRKGSNGVCLQAIKAGRKWLTTEAAFNRFLQARTESALKADFTPTTDKGFPADVSQEELEAVGLL